MKRGKDEWRTEEEKEKKIGKRRMGIKRINKKDGRKGKTRREIEESKGREEERKIWKERRN